MCNCAIVQLCNSAIVQHAIVQRAMPIVLHSPTHRCTISGLGAGQERDSGALLTIGKKCGIGRENLCIKKGCGGPNSSIVMMPENNVKYTIFILIPKPRGAIFGSS